MRSPTHRTDRVDSRRANASFRHPHRMTDATRPQVHADSERHITVQRTGRYVVMGDDRATDVWVCIHGFGQLARRFARDMGALVAPHRKIVVPEALNRYYIEAPGVEPQHRKVGATWMTKEDRETDIADYVAYLDALHAREVAPLAARGARVTALGFSQGVTTLVRWAVRGQSRIDRLVCWAGALPHDVDLTEPAVAARLHAMRPLEMAIGDSDEFASWAAIDEQRAKLEAASIPAVFHFFTGGHVIDGPLLASIAQG